MVKSYCVKQKKQTDCIAGSEKFVKTKNGRLMMKCICAECKIVKTRFVKGKEGGKVPWVVDFSKGFSLLKDAFKPKAVSTKTAKERVAGYRREYAKYKRDGGTKSFKNWGVDKGILEKPTF